MCCAGRALENRYCGPGPSPPRGHPAQSGARALPGQGHAKARAQPISCHPSRAHPRPPPSAFWRPPNCGNRPDPGRSPGNLVFKAWQLQGPQPAQSAPPPGKCCQSPSPPTREPQLPLPQLPGRDLAQRSRERRPGAPFNPLCPFSGGLPIPPTSAVALGVWELGSRTGRAVRGGQRGGGQQQVQSPREEKWKGLGGGLPEAEVLDALTWARLWFLLGRHLKMWPEVQTLTLDVGQAEWPELLSWAPPLPCSLLPSTEAFPCLSTGPPGGGS